MTDSTPMATNLYRKLRRITAAFITEPRPSSSEGAQRARLLSSRQLGYSRRTRSRARDEDTHRLLHAAVDGREARHHRVDKVGVVIQGHRLLPCFPDRVVSYNGNEGVNPAKRWEQASSIKSVGGSGDTCFHERVVYAKHSNSLSSARNDER